MIEVKIRYNAKNIDSNDLPWRVLIDGVEYLAKEVKIYTPVHTTKDFIEGFGERHHMTTEVSSVVWEDNICILN